MVLVFINSSVIVVNKSLFLIRNLIYVLQLVLWIIRPRSTGNCRWVCFRLCLQSIAAYVRCPPLVRPKLQRAPGLLSLTGRKKTDRQTDTTTALHIASFTYIGGEKKQEAKVIWQRLH